MKRIKYLGIYLPKETSGVLNVFRRFHLTAELENPWSRFLMLSKDLFLWVFTKDLFLIG